MDIELLKTDDTFGVQIKKDFSTDFYSFGFIKQWKWIPTYEKQWFDGQHISIDWLCFFWYKYY
jgi:hypothetical protein